MIVISVTKFAAAKNNCGISHTYTRRLTILIVLRASHKDYCLRSPFANRVDGVGIESLIFTTQDCSQCNAIHYINRPTTPGAVTTAANLLFFCRFPWTPKR